jgi:hypothetical protein
VILKFLGYFKRFLPSRLVRHKEIPQARISV